MHIYACKWHNNFTEQYSTQQVEVALLEERPPRNMVNAYACSDSFKGSFICTLPSHFRRVGPYISVLINTMYI